MRRIARAFALTLLVVGCQSAGERVEVGKWGDVEVVETARIGMLDGPDEYLFGNVMDIAVGPDGSVYVADSQLILVRQYRADVTFVRNIGRHGEGPGEYDRILGLEVTPDGTVAVLAAPHRIILFGSTGEYLRDFRVPSVFQGPGVFTHDVDGNFYVKDAVIDRPPTSDDWDMVYIKILPHGEVLGRIPLPRKEPSGKFGVLFTGEGPEYYFATMTTHAWSPLGYVIAGRNDAYTIERRDTTGVLGSFEHDWTPVSLNRGETSQWNAWADFMWKQTSTDRPVIPDVKPAFKDISVGDDGTVWVRRYAHAVKRDVALRPEGDDRPLLAWRDPPTYDAFDPDGAFLGTVVTPPDTWILAFHGRELWGVENGDEGPQVVGLEVVERR